MEKLKLFLTKIWNFLKSKVFIILVIVGLIIFSIIQCSRIREFKRQDIIDKQNQIALKDSLKFERKKTGELNVSIAGYIASEKELKELNEDLWKRIKAQDGKILSLNYVIIQLKQDSATLKKYLVEKDKVIERLTKIDSATYAAPWSLTYKYDKNNFDIFTGKTYIGVLNKDPLELAHIDTELIQRLTQIDLSWGQKIENKMLRVFIESAYPGFTVEQMSGVLIDPNTNDLLKKITKKKHWFTGFGVGPNISAGWNILQAKPAVIVGAGLHYNIYEW